jgi:hypothetical protein
MDLARLTIDIDGAMDEIVSLVDTVFKPAAPEHSPVSTHPSTAGNVPFPS